MNNINTLESLRKEFKKWEVEYTQMKVLDMGFWQIGYDKDKRIINNIL